LKDIGRPAWRDCFAGEIEGYDYHLALERAGMDDFTLGYYTLSAGEKILCCAPHFTTNYDLVTTAQGHVQTLLLVVRKYLPGRLKLGLSCLGAPETEFCQIGFTASLGALERQKLMQELLQGWQTDTAARGIGLLGIKDVGHVDNTCYGDVFTANGWQEVSSLPCAALKLPFRSIEDYLSSLSSATRKDLRRKLKLRHLVEVEFTTSVEEFLPEIMDMYHATRDASDWAFEELSAGYFREVLAARQSNAVVALYRDRAQGRLVGANLLLENDASMLDKIFVKHPSEGRRFNLYFLSWMANLERCIDKGMQTYIAGATAYETKLRLGCSLQQKSIYFRHSRPAVNLLLRSVAPLLAIDQPAPADAACWEHCQ